MTDLEAPPPRRRWIGRLLAAGVVLFLVLVGGVLVVTLLTESEGDSLVAAIAAGERPAAPGFDLEAIWPPAEARWPQDAAIMRDGRITTTELAGSATLVNFWASWCVPCREEAPILNAGAERMRGHVRFVGVDVQDLRDDALGFLREFAVVYPSVRDTANRTYERYGLTGVPETFLLDAHGRIIAHVPGPLDDARLDDLLTSATRTETTQSG